MITATTTETETVRVSSGELKSAIKRVLCAVSTDGLRYALDCVCLDIENETVDIVATDGRQLAYATIGTHTSNQAGRVLAPARDARALASKLSTTNTQARIELERSRVVVSWQSRGNTKSYVFQQPDGRFPRWRESVPEIVSGIPTTLSGKVSAFSIVFDPDRMLGVDLRIADTGAPSDLVVSGPVETYRAPRCKSKSALLQSSGPLSVSLDHTLVHAWLAKQPSDAQATLHYLHSSQPVVFTCGADQFVIMPIDRERRR